MAKISPVSIKYMVFASFKAEGPLEKPDVIGAIFGQTEGLLGAELEMRELQKEGKIGRIEVELETVDGKSLGKIKLPSALDKSETTLVAAALETIDRIGPTEAVIEITKIEDVRGNKRDYILGRAKKLLENLEDGDDLGEITRTLKEEARAAKIQEYGEEKLPAGDISGREVIVVEGRADVVNLLKNRVNNVIGMNGTKLPATISSLGQEKEITLFIDGDRGGKLIAKNVIGNAKIAYVAIAPDGKEVEELTGKEILMSLRKRIPSEDFLRMIVRNGDIVLENIEEMAEKTAPGLSAPSPEIREKLRAAYEKIKGAKSAVLLDKGFDVVRKTGAREVVSEIRGSRKEIFAVVIDGQALASVMKACDECNVQYCAATNFGTGYAGRVQLVSL